MDATTTVSEEFLKAAGHRDSPQICLSTDEAMTMPKLLWARTPENGDEERNVRKLAGSRHAPSDWIFRTRIISLSWRGFCTVRIPEELRCHPKTARKRLRRFNTECIDNLSWTLAILQRKG